MVSLCIMNSSNRTVTICHSLPIPFYSFIVSTLQLLLYSPLVPNFSFFLSTALFVLFTFIFQVVFLVLLYSLLSISPHNPCSLTIYCLFYFVFLLNVETWILFFVPFFHNLPQHYYACYFLSLWLFLVLILCFQQDIYFFTRFPFCLFHYYYSSSFLWYTCCLLLNMPKEFDNCTHATITNPNLLYEIKLRFPYMWYVHYNNQFNCNYVHLCVFSDIIKLCWMRFALSVYTVWVARSVKVLISAISQANSRSCATAQ